MSPAVARRDTEVLNDLIALTERVLTGPAPAPWIAEVEALGAEVTRAAQRPTDLRRAIGDGETMLIIALRHMCDVALVLTPARDRWRHVVLALRGVARADLLTAMNQEAGVASC